MNIRACAALNPIGQTTIIKINLNIKLDKSTIGIQQVNDDIYSSCLFYLSVLLLNLNLIRKISHIIIIILLYALSVLGEYLRVTIFSCSNSAIKTINE
jgi:mannose/fructose/N-acetylgalactosamine-specific phosphotransferase system component IID